MRKLFLTNLIVAFFVSLSSLANASNLQFNRNYSSNMVLQREKPVGIRGFAENGAKVTVSFGGQKKETTADDKGVWSVTLDPMTANKKGTDLTATSDGKSVKLSDVLIGDVFLFARQTSIDVSLGRDETGKKAATDLPSVRVMMIKTIPSETPQQDLLEESTNGWTAIDKGIALKMNATAFYVAQDLAKKSDISIGIIDLNLGDHFPISWLSKDALLETEEIFGKDGERVTSMMKIMEKDVAAFENEEERKKKDAKRGYPLLHPREDPRYPSVGYNSVLHPMHSLALKGIILQIGNDYPYVLNERLIREGKGISRPHLSQAYEDTYDIRKWCIYLEPITTPRIPREWRRTFGDESVPVGWITPPGSDLVTMGRHHREMRELQRRTADDEKGVDLIISGTEHIPFSAQPADETLVADRCMAWLMGKVYQKEGVVSAGPVFDRVEMDYSKAQVFFKPGTAKGLQAKPGALDKFEVAGVDLEYFPAKAEIDGETIRLKSDKVTRIAYVRYNWSEKPEQGLTNIAGLPAISFNTDGHVYPRTISTLNEEILPPEFSTPVSQWKSEGAVIYNGKLNTKIEKGNGKYLGPTGLRVNTFGPNLYVVFAYKGSPADGKIFPGDFLYGVNGKLFGEDMFADVAEAITDSETEEKKGIIRFNLLRDGKKMTVDLQLEVLGSFSYTSPYDCPKTDRIVANAEALLAKYGGVFPEHPVFSDGDAMFLLAAGSPEYQGLVRRHVYNRMAKTDLNQEIDPNAKDPKPQGGPWDLSADILLMSEYYLATGDRAVLPYLRYKCDTLTTLQIRSPEEKGPWPKVQNIGQTGGWRHNFYGGATYGTMPAIGVPAALGYHLTKEAGVKYDFKGYERAVNWFLHNGAKVGSIGYGYHAQPVTSGNNIDPEKLAAGKLNPGNGGVAGAAILFDLQGNGPVARTCSFISTHSYNNTAYAHGGHFWVNFYTPLGAKVHGKTPFQFFMKGNRNYQELHRMHDHSRQQDRVFGVGQYLAYVVPRERLRILGAHESVFAPNPPEILHSALEAYHKRDYAACEKMAASLIEKGDLHGLDLKKTEQLRDAAALIQKSIDHDLTKVKDLIKEGKPYEASLDLTQLKAVVPEGNSDFSEIEKKISDPALKKAMGEDKKRYQAYLKSLPLQLPEIKKDEGPEWKTLVNKEDLKSKSEGQKPTVWRMKVVESLSVAPDAWTDNDYDDSEWTETTLPISWHTNHTAILRAPFEIDDPGAVKALRLRNWAFRQEDMQVFLNGKLLAKISASGSGGKEIIIPLNDYALSLLKKGRNTLSATYKNTWRWGRYFKGAKSVYNDGVHLILEMQDKD